MAQVLCLDSLLEDKFFLSQHVTCTQELDSPAMEEIETDDELVFPSSKFSLSDVPQKNTFIHYDIPRSPSAWLPPIPTSSAPSILLRRLFRAKAEESSISDAETSTTEVPMSCMSTERSILSTQGNTSERKNSDFKGTFAHESDVQVSAAGSIADVDSTGFATNANPLAQEMHIRRQCTPCNYFWHKADGCRQGDACSFCHLCTKGEIKKRKKDKLRDLRRAGLIRRGR